MGVEGQLGIAVGEGTCCSRSGCAWIVPDLTKVQIFLQLCCTMYDFRRKQLLIKSNKQKKS